jgi:hypothetical protein
MIIEILLLLRILISVIVSIYCVNRADRLNQSKLLWGLFGFFFPPIAFIVIQFIKPHQTS